MNNNLKKINIYVIYLGAIILILPLIAFFINALITAGLEAQSSINPSKVL